MNREEVLKKVIQATEKKVTRLEGQVAKVQEDINQSPDYRKTWSDTTRFQLRQLKRNFNNDLQKAQEALRMLKELNQDSGKIGSLVEIDQETYFIVPSGASREPFVVEGRTVTPLSIDAPLAQKME